MNEFYQFLMEFTKGTTPTKAHLQRRYGNEKLLEALHQGYIVMFGPERGEDTQYTITAKGKEKRDR